MNKRTNISLIANGEVCGFPSEFGIARINGETTIIGTLYTKGKSAEDFLRSQELGINELSQHLTVPPKTDTDLTVSFIKRTDQSAFSLTSGGILCGIQLNRENKQMLLMLHTNCLNYENKFEKFVANAAKWAHISELTLLIQNKGSHNYVLLQKLSDKFDSITIPNEYAEKYQLIASGIFNLNQTNFGKYISTLTGKKQLLFAVGGSFEDKSFGAQLISEKIETDTFIIENLLLGMQKSATGFYCIASGSFIFTLEDCKINFTLSGAVSPQSFILSAASPPNVRIPLISQLPFSDLALSIGVNSGALTFGMTGRLNTDHLSVFGGFVITPPRITLLTAALTSTTGRISLKDLVVEIVDIHWEAVDCLDVVAIGDFDIPETSLTGGGIKNFPTNFNCEEYQENKKNIETKVKENFNKNSELKITGEAQLTPLGDHTDQYILTDKGNMRHYRIDKDGKISLNCQIYLCLQATKLGNYDMPAGFFICGTLEIFGKKIRFLFLAEKGKSLVALVQIDKINILNGLFLLEKSSKELPIKAIDGGVAGQLVKANEEGATLYLNIQKNKGEVIFYVSARISLLRIFNLDTLILIKNKFVYINIEKELAGFKTTLNLKGSYQNFAEDGFSASICFDTSGFQDILEQAQKTLRSAAQSVEKGVKEANRKVEEAQNNILNLQRKIDGYNNRIRVCKEEISKAKWYQIGKKIARGLEIAGLEIAKAGVYVAIGVAYSALEVAKAALKLGGAVVSTVLKSIAYVISATTQILWVKSFELGITATKQTQKINAKLVLTVFGKDIQLGGELNLAGLVDNIKNFVSGSINKQSDKLLEDIKSGKVTKAMDAIPESKINLDFIKEYCDLNKNKEKYEELSILRNATDELFISSNKAYFDIFEEERPDAREEACHLTELRWEEEILHEQHSNAFDDEFIESLENVIQVIRQEKAANRAKLPEDKENEMNTLLDIVKGTRAKQIHRTPKKKSLFVRMEENSDIKYRMKRTGTTAAELSAEEANKQYAEALSKLIDEHLGNRKNDVAQNLKRDFSIALYQFRNPDDTFRKRDYDDNNDEDEDF